MAGKIYTDWLSATDKDAALGRIGCAGLHGRMSAWKIVDWFVRLARNQRPFSEMASIEVELLRHEYRALQEVLQEKTGGLTQNVVSLKDLEKFRLEVRKHLEQLADTGHTAFGPFNLTRFVDMPRGSNSSGAALDKQVYSGDWVEPFDGKGLLYHLSNLIGNIGLAILRCPDCTQIFLRARADADHCSRPCQARAHSRRQRESEQKKKLQVSERRNARKRLPGAKIQRRVGKG
jgi:hypothetical protein